MPASNEDPVSEDSHLQTALQSNIMLPNNNSNELIKAIDELLDLVSIKFSKISTEVFAKMDEMAQRLDELEASIKAGADASEGN